MEGETEPTDCTRNAETRRNQNEKRLERQARIAEQNAEKVRGTTGVVEAIGAEAKGVVTATGIEKRIVNESAASNRGQASFGQAGIEANRQQKPDGEYENRLLSIVLM